MLTQPDGSSVARVGLVIALLVGFLAGLGTSGCSVSDPEVTIGKKFPLERLAAIKRGMSTKKQVEGLLGKPYKIKKLEGRKEVWRYYSREESVKRALLVISVKTFVTEYEVLVAFDGTFVESVDKQTNSYTE